MMPAQFIARISINTFVVLLDNLASNMIDQLGIDVFHSIEIDIDHFLQIMIILADTPVPSGKSRLDLKLPFCFIDQLISDHFAEKLTDQTLTGDRTVNIEKRRASSFGCQ